MHPSKPCKVQILYTDVDENIPFILSHLNLLLMMDNASIAFALAIANNKSGLTGIAYKWACEESNAQARLNVGEIM